MPPKHHERRYRYSQALASACLLQPVCLHVSLLAGVGDASQLPFSREFLVQHFELVDQLLANRREHISGRDSAVCLYAQKQLWYVGVADYVTVSMKAHGKGTCGLGKYLCNQP